MAWTGVITNAGAAMLATYAQGGHTMTIDSAVVGSGNTAAEDMRTATALAVQEDTAAITGTSAQGANVQIRVQVSASADGGYSAKELGLYAHVDNGTSQLMALYQDPTGVSVPDITVNPDYAFGLYIAIAISNTDDLAVEVDTSATVSIGELTDALALKVDKTVYEAAIAGLVSKSGDTMSGNLIAPNMYTKGTYAKIGYVDPDGNVIAWVQAPSSNHRFAFSQFAIETPEFDDIYQLPYASSRLTEPHSYQILTSKNAVTVAQGGTGGTSPAEARENIHAVYRGGDTMTGNLGLKGTYPKLNYVDANGNTSAWIQANTAGRRLNFKQYGTDFVHGDEYFLPYAPGEVTADKSYDILTTKTPVTVAQGGTGATTKSGSRKNLGIEVQRGSQNVGSSMSASVTFAEEFSAIPTVIATGNLNGNVWVTDITRTGCTIKSSVASNQVRWLAIYIS